MKCQDVMKLDLEWVPGTTTVLDAARMMRDRSLGFLLVTDPVAGKEVGIVTDRDLAVRVCAEGLNSITTRVGEVATLELLTCRDEEDLEDAEQRMGEHQTARLVVVDSAAKVVGTLSLTDILRGDKAGRAVKTANAVSAREAPGSQTSIEDIHLTASTVEEEETAANREHALGRGNHGGSMKEFPG